jgi:hypothetical protein
MERCLACEADRSEPWSAASLARPIGRNRGALPRLLRRPAEQDFGRQVRGRSGRGEYDPLVPFLFSKPYILTIELRTAIL